MTDHDKLKSLLDEFGVGYEEKQYGEKKLIMCEEGNEKVSGYFGFVTTFVFKNDGEFINMGAWE